MEEQDQTQSAARMCPKGCGFFGHDNYNGFCSKCHQSMQQSKNPNEPRIGSSKLVAYFITVFLTADGGFLYPK